jgi:hypothetical protein
MTWVHIDPLPNLKVLSLSNVHIFGTFGKYFHVPSVVKIEFYGVICDNNIPIDTLEAANYHLTLNESCPRSASITVLPHSPTRRLLLRVYGRPMVAESS